ncbi:MAG: arginine--tRNA ligase [Gemmataceae bacterium]
MNISRALEQRFARALAGLSADPAPLASLVRPAQDPKHGDYQANCAMPLSKELGQPPRQVAQTIVERLDLGDMLEPPEIAGPGFINLRLRTDWVARQVQAIAPGDRLGVDPAQPPRTIVLDYSSPNVAKPLHVGHLRSSIIGDSLTRLLRFLGHRVVTDNHLGDWGTQFGILLYGYKNLRDDAAYQRDPVRELTRLYIEVRKLFKKKEEDEGEGPIDDPVQDACRLETAKLHHGDPENVALWQQFMPHCLEEINQVYARLGLLPFDHTLGESFYQPMLAGVVTDLAARGIAEESQGAKVIFFGDPEKVAPSIVQKRDGAFTYTTTDLATIRYRMDQWQPDAILYVVGMPQNVHFKNLFAAARRWGYEKVDLQHVAFGSVLSAEGKMLATRKGGNTLLGELLDDAIAAAARVHDRLHQDARERGEEVMEFTDAEKRAIHEAVGIGAVKYADLAQARTSDYKFDLAKMTSTEGNTATYMQYAYARCRSIFRKGEVDDAPFRQTPPLPELPTPQERALALTLLRLPEALAAAAADNRPNLITAYLWDLSRAYSTFFTHCPVLKAETPALKQGRLLLCDLTARTIRLGLDLLGIRTIERM